MANNISKSINTELYFAACLTQPVQFESDFVIIVASTGKYPLFFQPIGMLFWFAFIIDDIVDQFVNIFKPDKIVKRVVGVRRSAI